MNCTDISELIFDQAAGRLDAEKSAALDAHVRECDGCRTDMEATEWLATAVRNHRERIDAGHLSARLLYEYASDGERFDEDAVESIWSHLDTCDTCADDLDAIKQMLAAPPGERSAAARPASRAAAPASAPPSSAPTKPVAVPSTPASPPPVPRPRPRPVATSAWQPVRQWIDWFASLPRSPKLALVGSVVAVAAVIVSVSAYNAFFSGEPVVAKWVGNEIFSGRTPVQEVAVSLIRRGASGAPRTDVHLSDISAIVVAVDLDRIDGRAEGYDMVIRSPKDSEVFRERIASSYFSEGRLLLQLEARRFPPGDYAVGIDAVRIDGSTTRVAHGVMHVIR